jgi:membrane protease YdiL (CAAX protease family)
MLGVPLSPLPPELKERSERNYSYLLFPTYALVCAYVWFLMRRYSVPPGAVGLHLHHWGRCLGLGVGAAGAYLAWNWFMGALAASSARKAAALGRKPVPYQAPDHLARGSALFWILTDLVGCLAEEFWRAFCLVSLERLHHGATFALVATSLAFALAHYRGGQAVRLELAWLFAYAVFGGLFGVVFLWSRSIVSTYTGHLWINLVALYRARRRRTP